MAGWQFWRQEGSEIAIISREHVAVRGPTGLLSLEGGGAVDWGSNFKR